MRGEGHSREAFEAAQQEEAKGRQNFIEQHRKTADAKSYRGEKLNMVEELQQSLERMGISVDSRAASRWDRAQKHLKQLLNEGHEEANELNQEYGRLQGEVVRAMQAVQDFERDKLGMKPEEENDEAA